ncbi:MAG TPA: TolC family protein [Spirochaetota bacterium]|nr:TolC family protein [Spirochaetota bacterium]HRZ28399.1 TolC family protein [Spirochaetota bacterium]HSA15998.1 TolC family protein [Spirochaetota bacterium]
MKKKLYCFAILALTSLSSVFSQSLLTLDECKKLALANNYAMKNSDLEIEESRKLKNSAIAKYFPKLSAGAFAFAANENLLEKSIELPGQFAALMPGGLTFGMLEKGNVSYVNLVQPVYAGGRIYFGNQLASLGVEAGRFRRKLSENDMVLKTEEQYWRIVCLNRKAVTISKYGELLDALLRQVEDANRAGIVMKNDVLRVRQKKSEMLLNKSKLENGKTIATMAFCQFMGISYDSNIVFDGDIQDVDPESLYVDPVQALGGRPEYILLKKSVEAEKLKAKMKMGEFLPQVGVGVSAMYYGFDDDKNRFNGVLYGQVSVPISDWWGGAYELKGQSIRKTIAENNLKDKTDLLLLQMEKAWQDLNDAYKQVALAEDSMRQADENQKVTADSYYNGLVNLSDMLEAQAVLQEARDGIIEAKVNYRLKQIYYMQATGR